MLGTKLFFVFVGPFGIVVGFIVGEYCFGLVLFWYCLGDCFGIGFGVVWDGFGIVWG